MNEQKSIISRPVSLLLLLFFWASFAYFFYLLAFHPGWLRTRLMMRSMNIPMPFVHQKVLAIQPLLASFWWLFILSALLVGLLERVGRWRVAIYVSMTIVCFTGIGLCQFAFYGTVKNIFVAGDITDNPDDPNILVGIVATDTDFQREPMVMPESLVTGVSLIQRQLLDIPPGKRNFPHWLEIIWGQYQHTPLSPELHKISLRGTLKGFPSAHAMVRDNFVARKEFSVEMEYPGSWPPGGDEVPEFLHWQLWRAANEAVGGFVQRDTDFSGDLEYLDVELDSGIQASWYQSWRHWFFLENGQVVRLLGRNRYLRQHNPLREYGRASHFATNRFSGVYVQVVDDKAIVFGEHISVPGNFTDCAVSPLGVSILLANANGDVFWYSALDLWRKDELSLLQTFTTSQTIEKLQFGPHGRHAFFVGKNTIHGWDLYRGYDKSHFAIPISQQIHDFVVCGEELFVATASDKITVYSLQTKQAIGELAQHSGAVLDLDLSADGSHLLSVGSDNQVCVWQVKTGKLLANFSTSNEVAAVSFTDFSIDSVFTVGLKNGKILLLPRD